MVVNNSNEQQGADFAEVVISRLQAKGKGPYLGDFGEFCEAVSQQEDSLYSVYVSDPRNNSGYNDDLELTDEANNWWNGVGEVYIYWANTKVAKIQL